MSHLFNADPNNKVLYSGRYYTDSTNFVEKFNATLGDPTQTVYVGYGNAKQARYGSIGIAVPKGYDPKDRANWPAYVSINVRSGYYSYLSTFDVYWDKKHVSKEVSVYSSEMYWLTTHTGPTKWVFTKSAAIPKPKVVAVDKLGNEVVEGDFVTFVARSTYGKGKGVLMFGFVTKVTAAGIMTCKNIKLSDDDYEREWRVAKGDQVSKLNKEILNQLMLRRLTF